MLPTTLLTFFRRRGKILLVTFLLIIAIRLLQWQPTPYLYRAEMRFIVGTEPVDILNVTEEEKYYQWVASEYVVAGISDYANGGDFAQLVSEQMQARGYSEFDVETTSEHISSGFERSRLIIAVVNADESLIKPLADSAATVLLGMPTESLTAERGAFPIDLAIPQLETAPAYIYPYDRDLLITELNSAADLRTELFQILLTAMIGAAIVGFAADYFDPTIYSGRVAATNLALPLLGEIPKK